MSDVQRLFAFADPSQHQNLILPLPMHARYRSSLEFGCRLQDPCLRDACEKGTQLVRG